MKDEKTKVQPTADLTAEELTDWIYPQFDEKKDHHEHAVQSVDIQDWLDKDGAPEIVKKEFEGGLDGYGIFLENVFSRRECQKIIAATEKIGYGHLGRGGTGRAYRGNHRLQIDDTHENLAKIIWARIKKFIPEAETIAGEGDFVFDHVNSRYRFAKYFAGQGFALHKDKPTIYGNDFCSIYTVNIYLNDLTPEQKGLTRFFEKMLVNKDTTPIASAGGVAGGILIFKQSLAPFSPIHDGDQVMSGLKYLMRTDIIYRVVSPS
eukprot:TRINITY_DN12288_c0_g1_i1.p1 TRINITY_DN12288_c0_g1~~TRINITY_DN12288_c0_g1_i1.p1  ORF type:complete len:271 (-),score=38.06 TRINITY_DN12288_c0_g1_i1:198-986(-)